MKDIISFNGGAQVDEKYLLERLEPVMEDFNILLQGLRDELKRKNLH
ncbi:MAG: hypothetical protein QNJ36_16840 [Calothrix sp. MO_167.B42]|nr:hypothetical protein [Calothrix sp. MO_167.B42]